jgi:hypothetical protein
VEAAVQAVAATPSWFSSSSNGSSEAADGGRAEVLAWLLQDTADRPLDLTLVNAR